MTAELCCITFCSYFTRGSDVYIIFLQNRNYMI